MSIPHLAFCPQCKKPNWILNFTRFATVSCQNCQADLDVLSDHLLFQTILDHQLLSVIGRGGMGRVYLAQNTKWKNYVAAKAQIHRETSVEQKERFWNEARILKDFDHPNIVKFTGAIENELGSFLFMEYFPGMKLSHLIVQQSPVPMKQILFLFREVCLALQHVHERGYLHQDLKPNNVLVGEKGDIRLIDFGISVSKTVTTRQEKTMGTFSYMAPEQLAGKTVDERTDIYSLGTLFFFMLTGQKPFDPILFPEIKKQTFFNNLVGLIKQPNAYLPAILDLLARMTEPLPEKRFTNLQEILDSLENCSPEKSPQQSKIWLDQKLKDQNILVASIASSGTWQAIPARLNTLRPSRFSLTKKTLFLFLSIFLLVMGAGYFFKDQILIVLNPIFSKTETISEEPPFVEIKNPLTGVILSPEEKLVQQLEIQSGTEIWDQFFLMVSQKKEPPRGATRGTRLQARFLLEWRTFFNRMLSPDILNGFNIFLEGLPHPKSFLGEFIEFLFDPHYPEETRKFLFQCLLKHQQLSLLLPYYQHPQLKIILNWNPEKKFSWVSDLLIQEPADARLFEFFQILSSEEQLLLETQGAQRESDLQKKIIAKYKNKTPLEESLWIALFQKPEYFKQVFYFLTKIQTEASYQLLFQLLLETSQNSEPGELLWNYFNQFNGSIPLHIASVLKYLRRKTKSEIERQRWINLFRKLSGIDLTFANEVESEYLRLQESKGSKGFQLGWQQDLFGFVLASLSENGTFQVFYFEKLKKNQFLDISFEEQVNASRTYPLFFQELFLSWFLSRYPELKQNIPKPKEFREETAFSQFREGLDHLTQSVFSLLEALPAEKISPKRLQRALRRFRDKQLVATTELQRAVSAYYGLLDALLILGSESEEEEYRAFLQKWDPLCETAEDQILLALNVLLMRVYSWIPEPLFNLRKE
ncbi:MAG: serine/threonine-protein kinase [Planctomycetota bacterium]